MSAPQYVMMSPLYKALMSFAVIAVFGGFGWYHLDNGAVGYAVFALAGFLILGTWIFPDNDEIKVTPELSNSESGEASP